LLGVLAQLRECSVIEMRVRALAFLDARELRELGPDLLRVFAQERKFGILGKKMGSPILPDVCKLGLLRSDLLRISTQGRKVGILELKMRVLGFRRLGIGAGRLCKPEEGCANQP
jgi:hypothetical protein